MSEAFNKSQMIQNDALGEVRVADEVVAVVAGLAATEVEGVEALEGGFTRAQIGKIGMKGMTKGLKVEVNDGIVSADISIFVNAGSSIPEVCAKVQEKVKFAVESMTGLSVTVVNVTVAGVTAG